MEQNFSSVLLTEIDREKFDIESDAEHFKKNIIDEVIDSMVNKNENYIFNKEIKEFKSLNFDKQTKKYDIFKKVSTRIELPTGKTAFEKSINNDPEKYFTDDVMKQLEVAVAKEFKYGDAETENTDDEV